MLVAGDEAAVEAQLQELAAGVTDHFARVAPSPGADPERISALLACPAAQGGLA
jgi:phenylpyruvate tautomerase PptA (4-oxalocrotonate tautomerase family)